MLATVPTPMEAQAGAGFEQKLLAVMNTFCDGDIDRAESMYLQLCEEAPFLREMVVLPVLIALQRGQTLDALRFVDSQPAGSCPGLRPLCLKVLDDPTWQGEARALLDSPDPQIVKAMQQLLSIEPQA